MTILETVKGRAATIGLLGLILGLAACVESSIELVVTPVPPRLKAGSEGVIEVRVVAEGTFPQATLTATARSPGVTISPPSFVMPASVPRSQSTAVNSPPNPPALGVVPMRTFRISAAQAGDVIVAVRLISGAGAVERSISIGVDP